VVPRHSAERSADDVTEYHDSQSIAGTSGRLFAASRRLLREIRHRENMLRVLFGDMS
jgi:hypothetical protein